MNSDGLPSPRRAAAAAALVHATGHPKAGPSLAAQGVGAHNNAAQNIAAQAVVATTHQFGLGQQGHMNFGFPPGHPAQRRAASVQSVLPLQGGMPQQQPTYVQLAPFNFGQQSQQTPFQGFYGQNPFFQVQM